MRILSAHPELARQHFEGLTPLLIAACFSSMPGQEALVTALLDRGADVNMDHCVGRPLSVAAGRGNVGVCRLLLDCGADIDMQGGEEGLSALMVACMNAHADCAKLLLDRGADLNLTSSHAEQPQLKSALSLAVVSVSAPCPGLRHASISSSHSGPTSNFFWVQKPAFRLPAWKTSPWL